MTLSDFEWPFKLNRATSYDEIYGRRVGVDVETPVCLRR